MRRKKTQDTEHRNKAQMTEERAKRKKRAEDSAFRTYINLQRTEDKA